MSGNKFFRKSSHLSNENGEYYSTAHLFWKRPTIHADSLSLDKEWDLALQELNDNKEVEISDIETVGNNELVSKVVPTVTKEQEIRMQEIEDIIFNNAIIRNIDGSLSIWRGDLYQILDLQTFTQDVRRILPNASQKQIRSFNKFKEAVSVGGN